MGIENFDGFGEELLGFCANLGELEKQKLIMINLDFPPRGSLAHFQRDNREI